MVLAVGVLLALVVLGRARTAYAMAGYCDERGASAVAPAPPPVPVFVLVDAHTVGFCDPRGATGIAPLPAFPMSDAVIDGADDFSFESRGPAALGGHDESPVQRSAEGSLDHVILGAPLEVPVAFECDLLPRERASQLMLPSGYPPGVEHPPRR